MKNFFKIPGQALFDPGHSIVPLTMVIKWSPEAELFNTCPESIQTQVLGEL